MRNVRILKLCIAIFSLTTLLVTGAFQLQAQSVFVRNYGQQIVDTRIEWSGDSLIYGGTAKTANTKGTDFYLMKADTNGIPSFSFVYDFGSQDRLTHLRPLANGDILFAGNTWANTAPTAAAHPDSSSIIIGRVGPTGTLQSAYQYTDTSSFRRGGTLTGLVGTADGGFIFSAVFTSSNSVSQSKGINLLVTKVGPSNTILWQEQYSVSANQNNFHQTAPRSALSLAPNGDVLVGWHDNLNGGGINLVRLKDQVAPTPRQSFRKRFKGNRLLAVDYQQNADSIILYCQVNNTDFGIMHLDNRGIFSWGALDLPLASATHPFQVNAILKNEGDFTPVMVPNLNKLTLWGENMVIPEGIENPYRGHINDFVTKGKTSYLALTLAINDRNQPMLVKSAINDSVSNCYSYYKPHTRFIPLTLEPDTFPVAFPVQRNRIRDTLVMLTRSFLRVDTTIICKGIGKVWPGDANSDGVANVRDVLNVGLAFGLTGPPRDINAQDSTWSPFTAPRWFSDFQNGVDYRQADCNGDGNVNRRDLAPILMNYRQMHGKATDISFCDDSVGLPPLYLQVLQDSVPVGDTLRIPVMLGDPAFPLDSIYGFSFTLCYDMSLVDSLGVKFVPTPSWFGDIEKDVIGIQKDFFLTGELDVGLSNITHQNKTGHGQVGYVEIFTIDDLIGKKEFTFENFHLRLKNIYAITHGEVEVCLSGLQDSVVLYQEKTTTAIEPITVSSHINIFPNPTEGNFTLRTPLFPQHQVYLYNSLGQQLQHHLISGAEFTFDLTGHAPGIYFLRGESEEKSWVKKVVVR